MKLHAFIQDNLDAIVGEWEAFARTLLPAAKTMPALALRNPCREMLIAIVNHMHTGQIEEARSGRSDPPGTSPASTAAAHGALRQAAGFDLAQVVSEFRALRLSVLALWRGFEVTNDTAAVIEEIARFNEAIDQALGESVQRFSSDVAASRAMFLAVLGHDLRGPLQGIQIASDVLVMPGLSDAARLQTAMRVRRASKVMNGLITDLLEFTRSRLGRGIPIERSDCDLRQACEEALDTVKASNPEHEFVQEVSGDLNIRGDYPRLQQVLSNLLNNAVQHGDKQAPVSLRARGEEAAIVVAIANSGKPIPADALRVIFEPLVQVPTTTAELMRRPKTSLGLGLFIAREIVLSHHGTIDVQSAAETGTVFTVRLPRATPGNDANASGIAASSART